jgi:hypothetical protein
MGLVENLKIKQSAYQYQGQQGDTDSGNQQATTEKCRLTQIVFEIRMDVTRHRNI